MLDTIKKDGTKATIELFGQFSEEGTPFNQGYYISLATGSYYFAEGEEKERDAFLKEKGVFDTESPTWEALYEFDGDSFYYSEWNVEDGLDGGFSSEGVYYLYNEDTEIFEEE